MTLLDHLAELRTRLFISLGAWVLASMVGFAFQAPILEFLKTPLPEDQPLISTQLLEPFIASMQIAAFVGFIIALPIILLQVWGFIAPGLHKEERRWSVPFVLLSVLAFSLGVAFSWYIVLPFALPILLGFLPGIETLVRIGDYVSKITLYMAVFGILFEMPVLGFLLGRLGILYASTLVHYRRYSIVIGCITAAVITPTADPFNFALVAIPLVVLYEITIGVVRLSQRRIQSGTEDSRAA